MADYNRWTNYETWCTKLWIDNDQGMQKYWLEQVQRAWDDAPTNVFSRDRRQEVRIHLAEMLKEEHAEQADAWAPDSACVFSDLLTASLGAVNWYEIADGLIDDSGELNQ